ncbi:hypothetical protein BI350_16480 [Sporosarcina ureilytica]|uniref:Uncharacterized protein n=1 Tax=Sporosarcina ureilytica TaxID=298596 RepID=A0A1D8JJV7_9BACL|nr:hypothetical protein BI350_16480 [Sporosarcina ureilytica]
MGLAGQVRPRSGASATEEAHRPPHGKRPPGTKINIVRILMLDDIMFIRNFFNERTSHVYVKIDLHADYMSSKLNSSGGVRWKIGLLNL